MKHTQNILNFFLSIIFILSCLSCGSTRGGIAYYVLMNDAQGLEKGAGVYISGVKMGEVQKVALADRRACIEFGLSPEVALFGDARASIRAFALADADMHLEIEPGSQNRKKLQEGDRVLFDESSIFDEEFKNVVSSIDSVLASLALGKGILGRLINDSQLGDKLESFLTNCCPQQKN